MKNNILKRKAKSMIFLLLPMIAGLAIALQTAVSGHETQRIGALQTVILIHFFGLIAALIVYFIQGNTSFNFIGKTTLLTIVGGALGVIIVFTISKSFIVNGALTTVMISVLVQLILSKLIDHYGLFGITRNPINLTQLLAIALMVSGVLLFQVKN